jgi:hypothetical protein
VDPLIFFHNWRNTRKRKYKKITVREDHSPRLPGNPAVEPSKTERQRRKTGLPIQGRPTQKHKFLIHTKNLRVAPGYKMLRRRRQEGQNPYIIRLASIVLESASSVSDIEFGAKDALHPTTNPQPTFIKVKSTFQISKKKGRRSRNNQVERENK